MLITLGVAIYSGFLGAGRDFTSSIQRTFDELHLADISVKIQAAPSTVVDKIAALPNVAVAEGRLVVDTSLELPHGSRDEYGLARLVGIPSSRHPAVNDLLIKEGRYLEPKDELVAVLEHHFIEAYNLKRGEVVCPIVGGKVVDVKIIGVAISPEYLAPVSGEQNMLPSSQTFAVLYVPLKSLQQLTGRPDTINEINLLVRDRSRRKETLGEVRKILSPYKIEKTYVQEKLPGVVGLRMETSAVKPFTYSMSGLILAIAAVAIYIAMSRLVQTQQPQIGLMRALGFGQRTVMGYYTTFALLLAFLGTLLGCLLGYGLQIGIVRAYAQQMGIPLLTSAFYPTLVLESTFLSLAFCLLGAVWPARASSRVAPAEAMRLTPAITAGLGSAPWVEQLWPGRLPMTVRIPLRNTFRSRRRALSTLLGVAFAFILLIPGVGCFESARYMYELQFKVIERWDLITNFSTPQPTSLIKKVSGWKGVNKIEPTLNLPATLKVDGRGAEVTLTGLEPSTTLHAFQLPRGEIGKLRPGEIILTPWLLSKLKMVKGDTISVETPYGTRKFTVSTSTDELLPSVAYIPLADAQAIAGNRDLINGLMLTAEEPHVSVIKNKLYHLPGVSRTAIKTELQAAWQTFMGFFYTFTTLMFMCAALMAGGIVFVTMSINVMERTRELATMRALGTSRRQIGWFMTLENLLLTAVATPIGLLVGWVVNIYMIQLFNTETIALRPILYPRALLIMVALVVAVVLLSEWPVKRHIGRLKLAEITKMRT
jgi:putative ABC transport system permease protein